LPDYSVYLVVWWRVNVLLFYGQLTPSDVMQNIHDLKKHHARKALYPMCLRMTSYAFAGGQNMKIRDAARAVLLDSTNRVLLIKIEDKTVFDPKHPKKGAFWVTPGGQVEAGESHTQAVQRELHEEIGLTDVEVGRCLWHGENDLMWKGEPTRAREKFFLVPAPSHHIDMSRMTDNEKVVYRAHRWFTSQEMRQCPEMILPRDMPELLDEVVAAGGVILQEKEIDLSTPPSSEKKDSKDDSEES
jgi:ADP-ribose pyrophosphatase YjhB (NUDIX family)